MLLELTPATIGLNVGLAVVAFFYAHLLEWSMHRYLFHGLGKKKGSPFGFHWQEHHRACRKNNNLDPDYLDPTKKWQGPKFRENFGVTGLVLVHLPIALVSPLAFLVIAAHGFKYAYKHRKSHLDEAWCKKNMPWHWDHHMAPNQDTNWMVSCEWFDKLMGTRTVYYTPESEKEKAA